MPIRSPEELLKTIEALARKKVLVGIPAENNTREGEEIGNAVIGYINEFGSPLKNIPPRPHLIPGVEEVLDKVTERLKAAARAAMRGDSAAVEAHLDGAGEIASDNVQRKIRSGLEPQLAEVTVLSRQIRSPELHYRVRARLAQDPAAARQAQAAGLISSYRRQSRDTATPLYDTGDYLRAITWVVRDGS